MPFVIIIVAVAVAVAVVVLLRRRGGGVEAGGGRGRTFTTEPEPTGPTVTEFHVADGTARVVFAVPLPAGDVDPVLSELLIREAIEVVREKRHSLPIGDVHRVVAFGSRAGVEVEVGRVELDTPGTLPPPMRPELLPHLSHPGFDAFARLTDLPGTPPGLAAKRGTEALEAMGPQLRLSRQVEAGLRAQGLDPGATDACDLMLGVMRLAGYAINERSADTLDATKSGQRVFIRMVCHVATDHPELEERQVDRFVVDFLTSRADRGLLITEKYSPFNIYDREKREPRMRFITRERLQDFVDALTLG